MAKTASDILEIATLSKEKREQVLKIFSDHASIDQWPNHIQIGVLGCVVKELVETEALDPAALVDVVTLAEDVASFSPLKKPLRDTTISGVEQAKLLQTLIVNMCLVPFISANRLEDAQALATSLQSSLKIAEESQTWAAVVNGACTEVLTCATAVVALMDPWAVDAVAKVDAVSAATRGSCLLMNKAITQNAELMKRQKNLRECDVAALSLGPKLQQQIASLKAST